MEEKKSFVYTIILGICLIGCLILIGKMMLTKPIPEHTPFYTTEQEWQISEHAQTDNAFTFTEDALNQWIQKQMPKGFPLTDLRVDIRLPNLLIFQGEIEQSQLKAYMEEKGLQRNAALNAALLAAPDRFSFSADVSVDLDQENRLPLFTVESVQVGKIRVSNSAFTQVIFDPVYQAIHQMICDRAIEYQSILWQDGSFVLKK